MKVVRTSVDISSWTIEVDCESCDSTLELEPEDISYEYNTDGRNYHATCCLCRTRLYFKSDDLPKIIRVDCEVKRKINNSCSDW